MMPKKKKPAKGNSRKLIVNNQQATSWGGTAIVSRLASRLGIWNRLEKNLPERRGKYDFLSIIKGAVAGFQTGSRGTALLNAVSEDEALLRDLEVGALPGEKIFWDDLERIGQGEAHRVTQASVADCALKALRKVEKEDIQIAHGFIPVFGDGTLLEGSTRREGTKCIKEKGRGLMWGAWLVGPMLAAEHLCADGEGEVAALRNTRNDVLEKILDPLGLRSDALVLKDSLHGNEPTLQWLEEEGLRGLIGGNQLSAVRERLEAFPDSEWKQVPAKTRQKGFEEEEVCVSYIQCENWKKKYLLVGKRFKRNGDLFWNYSGIFCNIPPDRIGCASHTDLDYMLIAWKLYSLKMGMEDRLKDLLIDLAGHLPPCQDLKRNRAYYTLLSLAHNLTRAVDLISGAKRRKGERKAGKRTTQRPRICTLRRHLFALPAYIHSHARQITVELIGGGSGNLKWFQQCWDTIAAG